MPPGQPEKLNRPAEPGFVERGEAEAKPPATSALAKPSPEGNGGTEEKPQAPDSQASAPQVLPRGYALSGPDSGEVGRSATFQILLDPAVHPSGIVRFTPSASNKDGTFGPAFLDLSAAARSGTFSYTPTTAGTRTIAITNNGGLNDPAPVSFLTKAHTATTYFIAPKPVSGSGTKEDPFGLPDLLNTTTTPVSQGPALTILRPGDTLECLGGTYHVSGTTTTDYYASQLISPTVSGTASAPITLQAYPGQTVTVIMDAGIQPIFGTIGPKLDYVRFLGFTVDCGQGPLVNGAPTSPPAFYISGTGNEVGYNEVVGIYVATADNHDGIRVDSANSAWIHNNNIRDVTGGDNSAGIKVYAAVQSIIEDNYIHGSNTGIFDKSAGTLDGANQPTYRRNWLTGNRNWPFQGNGYGAQARFYIYDNVFDGIVNLGARNSNSEVYNNLVRCPNTSPIYAFTTAGPGSFRAASLWNNIALFLRSAPAWSFADSYDTFASGPLQYMDYNVYGGAPLYNFGNYTSQQSTFNLAQFRARGFERHASVTAASNIFIDQTSYVLLPRWTTAGRYGDPVGPRFPIAQILNTSRYGPRALRTGTSPIITQQPQSQTVAVGETATFSVQVKGSGLCYQWQGSKNGGATWVNIGANWGANSAVFTYRPSTTDDSGAVFRCLVSCSQGSVWSDPAKLTITASAGAPPIGTQPPSRTSMPHPEGSKPVDRRKRGDLE
jgi:hypothetical protein